MHPRRRHHSDATDAKEIRAALEAGTPIWVELEQHDHAAPNEHPPARDLAPARARRAGGDSDRGDAFFRDVYDHFLPVNDLVESYRDLVTSALEAHLSVQSNRMNDIMKTLTLIATVMLPITFIAGVYGMNFDHMPELHTTWGYPAALGLMLVVALGCLWWFRRKGWIGSRELDVPEDLDDHEPPSKA